MHLFVSCCSFVLIATTSLAKPSKFLTSPLWDDGKSEISIYEAKRYHYGRLYSSKIKYFLVKETFSEKETVKTDEYQSKDAIPVIKLNQVISTPTGTYDYQQMHSSFWSKETGKLLKFSTSHHEACGATYKQGLLKNGKLHVQGSTYWKDQSQINDALTISKNLWFYDELPFRARLLVADGAPAKKNLKLVPSVIHSKAGSFQPEPASISIEATTVVINHAGGTDVLKFAPEWPHVMTSWQQADGESLILKKSLRLDYWNHHAPGDERLLK